MSTESPKNFNACAQLDIEDVYSTIVDNNKNDTLGNLMALQKDIQESVYGYDFSKMRDKISSLKEFFDMNYHAIQDELRETYTALTGIHSHPNAWKPWKKTHKIAMDKSFNDLSEEEKKELRMELVDIFHFFLNCCIAVDMSPEMLFNYYHAKNIENKNRQKKGY